MHTNYLLYAYAIALSIYNNLTITYQNTYYMFTTMHVMCCTCICLYFICSPSCITYLSVYYYMHTNYLLYAYAIALSISPSVNFRQAQVGPTSKVICIKFMGANILQYHYPWINKCV